MTAPPPSQNRPSHVAELAPLVRRVLGLRVSDPATADDLTQETLARLLAVEDRLDDTALAPYAVVTARNLARGLARSQERALRHRHRMVDPRQPEDPEERALQEEDRHALAGALDRLPALERQFLLAHDVEGIATAVLAERSGTTSGAVAVRLSRARARLRVEYLLGLRRVDLPTSRCRATLLAISAGDSRQQRALGAGEHLLACPACAALSGPLVRRRRPLAALWPFLGLDHALRWLRRVGGRHPAPVAVAGVAAAAFAGWAVADSTRQETSPPALFVQADPVVPLTGTEPLGAYAGMTVEARGVRVQSEGDERGFSVGESETDRVWVDVHDQTLPPQQLDPEQRVSFRASISVNTEETLETAGRGGPNDRAQLERQGYHLDVRGEAIQLAPQRR